METKKRAYYPVQWRADLPSLVCLLLGLGIIPTFNGWILVLDSHVIQPWMSSSVLLVASFVFWWRDPRRLRGYNRDKQYRSMLRSCTAMILISLLGTVCVLGALLDMDDETFILEPPGPAGCKAVVRESAFLMGGNGTVYSVNAMGIGREVSGWSTDDGYRPVEAGQYTLEWYASGGRLIVDGAMWNDAAKRKSINCD